MINKKHISKVFGGLLLALYLLSIMPRIVLHNMAANHSDVFVVQKTDSKEVVNNYTVHCQLQDQVCIEPGLPEYLYNILKRRSFCIDYTTALQKSLLSSPILSKLLRGPPSFA